jgi:hypothetical protein
MSTDALLWTGTLLFCATMLILAAQRRVDGADEGAIDFSDRDRFSPDSAVDLGNGWSLGGDSD